MKKCKICNEERPLEEYHFTDKEKKYRGSYCKKCYKIKNNKSVSKWQKLNEEKFRSFSRINSLNYHYKYQDKLNKIHKKYYYNQKDGFHYVYYLPEEHYVGVTDNLKFRMYEHKNAQNRNTSNYKILYRHTSREESLKVEAQFHNILACNG